MNPLVSVILPFHNCEKYLERSIKSILNQSYTNFELLLFDDASSDSSWEILKLFDDKRIKAFRSKENLGISAALNFLLAKAEGKYIARMDADDIAMPNRFDIQVNEMENDPRLIVLGSFAINIDENEDKKEVWSFPTRDEQIKCKLIFNTSFIHPSVFIKAEILQKHNIQYSIDLKHVEDRALWLKLIPYGKFKNISIPLIYYRRHEYQVSTANQAMQNELNAKLTINYWREIGLIIPSEDEFLIGQLIKGYQIEIETKDLPKINSYLHQLAKKIKGHSYLCEVEFKLLANQYWAIIGSESTNISLSYFWVWLRQSSTRKLSLDIVGKSFIKVMLKSFKQLKF